MAKQEATMEALEEQKAAIRQQQRELQARRVAEEEAAHDKMVRKYWAAEAKKNPDDPNVLRARAALLDTDRVNATVVEAATAVLEAEGGQ